VATDHAPHTLDEKLNGDYTTQPAGLPLIQHPLLLMLSAVHAGRISLSRMVQKMCHGPADLYGVKERGYLREGYWADMVLVDANATTTVRHEDCLYHCGWSPLDGETLSGKIHATWVNGKLAYDGEKPIPGIRGQELSFRIP